MSHAFTEYVRRLAPSGEPPDQESFALVWGELRLLLERQLRRQGLWDAPPSYLGIDGWPHWRGEALEELVAELYTYVFIDRLNALVDHLKIKADIHGLVLLNVRHFRYERQKKYDPLGYRIYEVFHQAVARAVEEEDLFVLKGNVRIRNDTVLGCHPDLDPDHLPPAPKEKVKEWNGALMPELVTGKGKAREWVINSLRTFLGRMPAEGIEAFTFRGILDPLKKDVRARWAARFEQTQGETGVEGDADEDGRTRVVPLVAPDLGVEDRDNLEKLDECLMAALDRQTPGQFRDDLKILWRDLHRRAQDDEIPSQRKLAEELLFPRRRLSELYATLRKLIDECRRATLTKVTVITEKGDRKSVV